MQAEIISIGDELLIGQVVNTNASWIGQQLSLIGIPVVRVTVIPDNREQILSSLNEAQKRAGLILITGGLGPTNDDITKEVLCEFFNTRLVFDPKTLQDIENLFSLRGFPVAGLNRQQAELPENCKIIRNNDGTAPGMWFEKDKAIFISLPGVPFEMKPMMTDYVLPELAKLSQQQTIFHKTVLTQGVGESFLAVKIKDWENNLPSNIRLAYLPHPGIVRLRLSAVGQDKAVLVWQVDEEIARLQHLIADFIVGYDDDTLEAIVGQLLAGRKQTLVTAESCTGGYLAHKITSVPGSSAYYLGSIIAYSNRLKMNLLDVKESDLSAYGAVSEQIVIAMAVAARSKLGSDYSIAVSGIAGPDGGTAEKPVGTTWIAVASAETVIAKRFLFGEHRERNIYKAAVTGLNMLRKMILGINKA